MEWVSDPQVWIAFATLAALEIVLGIDNIVFISILVGRLPEHRRAVGYRLGLGLAMAMRILLLLAISWEKGRSAAGTASFAAVMVQIGLLDIVFSLDSVITAVGMVDRVGVMVAAIVTAVLVMMLFAKAVGDFVGRHPTIRMLALAFLLLIGFMLVVEGTGHHVPKGYIYFAMAFSLFVELLNMRASSRAANPVQPREGG